MFSYVNLENVASLGSIPGAMASGDIFIRKKEKNEK